VSQRSSTDGACVIFIFTDHRTVIISSAGVSLSRRGRDALLADAIAWREADTLRAYVAAARRTSADGADIPRFEEWAQWALAAADRLDPISSGRELASWCAQAESAADEDED
jgi:hypothetical protein